MGYKRIVKKGAFFKLNKESTQKLNHEHAYIILMMIAYPMFRFEEYSEVLGKSEDFIKRRTAQIENILFAYTSEEARRICKYRPLVFRIHLLINAYEGGMTIEHYLRFLKHHVSIFLEKDVRDFVERNGIEQVI